MTKFNVGDRVVALRDDLDITKGKTYEVLEINNGWEFPVVLRDDVGDRNDMREIDLELAEEYEDETVKQLWVEIDALKAEMNGLAAQVTSLVADKPEPKPVFKAGDVVRFKTTYVDFEGEVAEDGECGEVIHNLFHPVVQTDSGAEVLIDTDEVEVSDVIEHVDISERSNESKMKESKTVVVEYDPIEWSDIKPGDVLICTEDGWDVSRGRVYQIESVDHGEAVFTDDVGDTHYWGEPVHVGINDNVAAFRQRPVY